MNTKSTALQARLPATAPEKFSDAMEKHQPQWLKTSAAVANLMPRGSKFDCPIYQNG